MAEDDITNALSDLNKKISEIHKLQKEISESKQTIDEMKKEKQAYLTEIFQACLQGTVYIVLMNAAVLFGVISIMKDFSDKPVTKDIWFDLIYFLLITLAAIAAYFTFVLFRLESFAIDSKFKKEEYRGNWLGKLAAGAGLVILSLGFFGYGVGILGLRIPKL